MRDDDLNRRLEGLRADVPAEPLPGAFAAREHSEHVRRTRRAGGTALAVLGVVSAVVLSAGGAGGLASSTPGTHSSSPSAAATLNNADFDAVSRGLLRFDPAWLPPRLGPWELVAAARTNAGAAVGCLVKVHGKPIDGVAQFNAPATFVSLDPSAPAAAVSSWASMTNDARGIARDVIRRVSACAGSAPQAVVTGPGVALRWQSGATSSTLLVVTKRRWVGAVAVQTPPGASELTGDEAATVATAISQSMGGRPTPSLAVSPPSRQGDARLYDALVPGAVVGGGRLGGVGFWGTPPCVPGLVNPLLSDDPRESSATAGDVVAEDNDSAGWPDDSGWVLQGATRMLTRESTTRLMTQWQDYVVDCPVNPQAEGSARIIKRYEVPGGVAFDLLFTAPGTNRLDGSPPPSPEPQGPRVRTVYVGKVGSVVTWICVEGAENHPELGPQILQRALDRLGPQS